MVFTITVDANPILAALLGGYARMIIFDPRFSFITTEFTIAEVRHHLPTISKKSGVAVQELAAALALLPLTTFDRFYYQEAMREARQRMGSIDPDDVDILSLTLHTATPIWTNDRHFEEVKPPIRLLHTRDFVL